METTITTEPQHIPTFEEFMASMEELRKRNEEMAQQMKEFREEEARWRKEYHEEEARWRKEAEQRQKEAEQRQKEAEQHSKELKDDFNLRLGRLTNLFGDFTIGEVSPMLHKKFNEFGFHFLKSNPNSIIDDYINDIHFEIDVILENSDKAMLVEVKTKLTKERIYEHIERLEKMRRYSNLRGDKRTFLGAVAGFTIANDEKKMALNEGLYVIEPSGDNFSITPPHGKPREW